MSTLPDWKVRGALDYANWRETEAAWAQSDAEGLLQRAQHYRQWASNLRASVAHCHHCGKPDEVDGDHTCPCPHRNEDCSEHPVPMSSSEVRQ